jgi:branched-chain amino acid transport system substrate-binding protein
MVYHLWRHTKRRIYLVSSEADGCKRVEDTSPNRWKRHTARSIPRAGIGITGRRNSMRGSNVRKDGGWRMNEKDNADRENSPRTGFNVNQTVSRRQFLKIAGIAGAAVGMSAGLGGVLAACGGTEETTTTAAAATTTTAGVTTTAGATTTVSVAPEAGRAVKIGLVSPKTGNFAVFAVADDWWIAHAKEGVKDGIVTGDGKLRQIELIVKDSQSDSNRASQVAGDLVTQDNVDMLLSSGSPDTCDPVATQAETLGCPSLQSFAPWQALYVDTAGKPVEFKWAFGNMLGSEQTIASFTDAFENSGVQTNKKVGMLFQNDSDAAGWMAASAAPKVFKEKGYTLTVPEYYSVPAEDFTKQIAQFKSAGCEIICGTNDPPWFSNFWTQCFQQGYKPKFVSSGKALIFPQAVTALPNNIGNGLLGECAWHPSWKIKDTLSDLDSEGLAADYEAKTGNQWTAAIACYAKFEWAVDIYKRATNAEDKAGVVDAIKTTNGMFQQGKVDFTEPVDANGFHVVANNYKPYIGASQWILQTDGTWDNVEVSNATAPGTTVQAKAIPIPYA